MRKIFLLTFLFPLYVSGQQFSVDRPEEIVKPDPYTRVYFGDKNNYKNVESITTIVKDRSNNFKDDTLSTWFYEKGLKVKSISFYNNQRSTTTFYSYNNNRDIVYWLTLEKNASTLNKYKYNKAGQLIETHQFRLTPKAKATDTAETSRMIFKYDKLKLVQITNNSLGADVIEQYHYTKDQLQDKTGGFVSKKFNYDQKGRIVGIKEFMGGYIDSAKFMGSQTFVYDDEDRLLTDSVLTSTNIPSNSYMVTQYEYDNKGAMLRMRGSYKNFFRDVMFKYADDKIKQVMLETNSNSAYLRFLISFRIPEYYSFPLQYREEFTYDAQGNRVSKKVYVNNELFTDVQYHITYTTHD